VSDATPPWRALRAPKGGHSAEEYEDAWSAGGGRFAVSDGASEASYAALWARLLAEGFVAAPRPWAGLGWLEGPRRAWSAAVDGLDLPWYAEMKREQGAYATLLGLAVRRGRWRALAVGDSCLIRARPGRPPRAFPLRRAADFGNQPALLGSRPGPAPTPARARGLCRPGDRLFLMTDALAQWFLRRAEDGGRPADDLARLLDGPDDAFGTWVEQRRGDGLRNDDVTLLAVGPFPEP
jgi:hypothetical protein